MSRDVHVDGLDDVADFQHLPSWRELAVAALHQEFSARPDVVLVQPADHGRIHAAGQAERRGAPAGPLAGWWRQFEADLAAVDRAIEREAYSGS
jgi:hypothetical protein